MVSHSTHLHLELYMCTHIHTVESISNNSTCLLSADPVRSGNPCAWVHVGVHTYKYTYKGLAGEAASFPGSIGRGQPSRYIYIYIYSRYYILPILYCCISAQYNMCFVAHCTYTYIFMYSLGLAMYGNSSVRTCERGALHALIWWKLLFCNTSLRTCVYYILSYTHTHTHTHILPFGFSCAMR